MYTFNSDHAQVRDRRSPYAARPPEPEQFPAEIALRDLRTHGTEEAAPLIVARYAALRAWLLGAGDTPAEFLDHARLTAEAYLASTPGDWPEGDPLRRLLRPSGPEDEAGQLLARVAGSAEALGHVDGALAAWTAAVTAALRAGRLDLAAGLALETAVFLRRWGAAEQAAVWQRASVQLARTQARRPPPSEP